jgi:hypothetical protein
LTVISLQSDCDFWHELFRLLLWTCLRISFQFFCRLTIFSTRFIGVVYLSKSSFPKWIAKFGWVSSISFQFTCLYWSQVVILFIGLGILSWYFLSINSGYHFLSFDFDCLAEFLSFMSLLRSKLCQASSFTLWRSNRHFSHYWTPNSLEIRPWIWSLTIMFT